MTPPKLVGKSFVEGEWRWTYSCSLNFNELSITHFTITDYYQKHLKHGITRGLIKSLVKNLNQKELEPRQKYNGWDIYVWEYIPKKNKECRLIFWFKDGTNKHLWIRNCRRID
ncbi:MAG: hypothetical protein I3273_00210 [Candidatus Moeniiplasma glomeromycotorum]|nr:hypothetical protein [Candidatus Moeniiplasma glomeromycotorum]MCE8167448.1 hypothetical protein [Candidatus Moeniiplasma glomeromycotorum]MCE8168538.1 hypothetical protein [Candidatus Moeniiplasma glomeromycotorum]